MAQVTIDGRTLTLPDDIAGDDARLREALEPYYPEARNATIQRTEQEGQMRVTLIKRAGPKGGLIAHLVHLPETIHPALLLVWELQQQERTRGLSVLELLARHAEIEQATRAGEADTALATATRNALISAAPAPAPTVLHGW